MKIARVSLADDEAYCSHHDRPSDFMWPSGELKKKALRALIRAEAFYLYIYEFNPKHQMQQKRPTTGLWRDAFWSGKSTSGSLTMASTCSTITVKVGGGGFMVGYF